MKTMNINKLSILTSLFAFLFFVSCSMIEELEYTVVQDPLQMHGGEVTLQINGKFVEKGINAKAVAGPPALAFNPINVAQRGKRKALPKRSAMIS